MTHILSPITEHTQNLIEYTTSFTVYPTDANCMTPLIFGGAFFSYMDKAAAVAVHRFLYGSKTCKTAVTYKFQGTFHRPCYIGDFIVLKAKIGKCGNKSIVATVEAWREATAGNGFSSYGGKYEEEFYISQEEKVAEAEYVFITVRDDKDVANKPNLLPYANHGLQNG